MKRPHVSALAVAAFALVLAVPVSVRIREHEASEHLQHVAAPAPYVAWKAGVTGRVQVPGPHGIPDPETGLVVQLATVAELERARG